MLPVTVAGPRRHCTGFRIPVRVELSGESTGVSLRQQARPELIAASGNRNNFDFGKFLFKIRQHRFISTDVDNDLALFLCGIEGLFPLLLQIGRAHV